MSVNVLILKNAAAVVEWGIRPAFSKSDLIAEINKRAAEIRVESETFQKAFTRTITEDDIGRTLYRASKTAAGPEVEPDAVQDFVAAPPTKGPAHEAMQALADAHNEKNPDKSPSQSYASVYSDPKNAELRHRVIAEHLSPRLASDAQEQLDSDRNAARNAREFGGRDVHGPRNTAPKGDVDKRVYTVRR